ncbi:T9SS type A sorting domain-containing protein [Sungkyunkwania multivorans]|uniref:T9SS type A sorting domain-containing protein n=1 Tax=Sungkyunkwania multivorans TaxID=1173618 RepID=A0ABW3D087_9FLAO
MKILTITMTFCFCVVASAQFNRNAPWMHDLSTADRATQPTFQEIQDAFNAYWQDKDPDVKGSGYKPFKRWEFHMQHSVGADGKLPTVEEQWQAWEDKKALINSSSRADLSNWTAIGPFTHTNTGSWSSGQGRVNVIAVDPSNSNTYYIGAPAGGIWKSTDAGINWTSLTDDLPRIGVSGIAIHPTNSNIIYIATGDDDAGDTPSVGVWKSVDGGATWNQTGLGPTNSPSRMNEVYINPSNTDMLWVATNDGVYRSLDAGATWTETLAGNIRDLKMKPGDPSTLYAVSSSQFFTSADFGVSFKATGSGLPTTSGRLVIDVTNAPTAENYVYVLSANTDNTFQGIYRSTSSGAFFTQMANTADIFESNQAWYDLALAVSDNDPDEIYVGCLNVWKSTNGGNTFSKLNNWNAPSAAAYTHADIHMLRFFNGVLYCGSDGGIYRSSNGGSSFSDLTATAAISQFYRIAVSKNNSTKMVGGLQDNGGHALNGTQWQNYYGADGMDTAISPNDDNIYYGFTQRGGSLNISTDAGASRDSQVGAPSGQTGNWVTPLVMNQDNELYAGYNNLYRLDGGSWTQLASAGARIDYLKIDPTDADIMYIALDRNLRKSTNRGASFSSVYTFSTNINSIEVSKANNDILYVTTAGTSSGGVYKSIDGGNSFTNITNNLPNETKYIVAHQGFHTQNPIYVGTSTGVYRLDDSSATWEPFEIGLPNVPVRDLEINLVDGNITAATYGRGIWQSAIPTEPAPGIDIGLVSVQKLNEDSVACGSVSPEVTVENNGTNTLSSATIIYTVDGSDNTYNWTGSLASGASTVIQLPALALSRGAHTFKVETSTTNDTYPDNNVSSRLTFYINDEGAGQQLNTFEGPSDELVAYNEGGTSALWERGIPAGIVLGAAAADGNAYGTNLAGDHPNNTKSYLVSQCYNLASMQDPVLKFDMAFELELDWDLVYMEYSTDGGVTWNHLGSASDPNWYNSNTPEGFNNTCFNCKGAQWTGTAATKTAYSYDLAALNAETDIIFRFVFHSDQAVVEEGVVIDNFVVDASAILSNDTFEKLQVAIYPIPSRDIFNIRWRQGSDAQFEVFDITGKRIKSFAIDQNDQLYTLDMSGAGPGVYLLSIQTENIKATRKLVVK